MMSGTDRRSVLTGLGVLGLGGCSRMMEARAASTPEQPGIEAIDLSSLEAREGSRGRLGFAAQDVASGRTLTWRADERFVYCSTFKMYLAAATLLRVQAGEERLDRRVPVTRADMVSHAPVTEPAIGSTLSIEQLMKGTVEVSDNPAANILIRELGGLAALQAFYRGLGDPTTRVDRLEPEMNRHDGDKDTIQPLQSARNLRRLLVDSDTPLSPASKAMLMRWLIDTPTGPGRIRAGVPAGWTVAHKTGTGGYGPTNDIGVVYPTTGGPIVIAAYFHGEPGFSAASREAVIADATRMALETLGHV